MSTPTKISKGDIVLIEFPFTDLSGKKLRPALVLFTERRNVVVAFISSKLEKFVEGTSLLIKENHPEFPLTGLKLSSVVRFDKVATVDVKFVAGTLGRLGPKLKEEANDILCRTLKL